MTMTCPVCAHAGDESTFNPKAGYYFAIYYTCPVCESHMVWNKVDKLLTVLKTGRAEVPGLKEAIRKLSERV